MNTSQTFAKRLMPALAVIALGLALSVGIAYAAVWTPPTATPPNGNTEAPINVGSTWQAKLGSLTIGSATQITPPAGLDVRNGLMTDTLGIWGGFFNFAPTTDNNIGGGSVTGKVLTAANSDGKVVWAAPTGGSGGSGNTYAMRYCTNAQSTQGNASAVAACVSAAQGLTGTAEAWRALSCQPVTNGSGNRYIATGVYLAFVNNTWMFSIGQNVTPSVECTDGSLIIVATNATAAAGGGGGGGTGIPGLTSTGTVTWTEWQSTDGASHGTWCGTATGMGTCNGYGAALNMQCSDGNVLLDFNYGQTAPLVWAGRIYLGHTHKSFCVNPSGIGLTK